MKYCQINNIYKKYRDDTKGDFEIISSLKNEKTGYTEEIVRSGIKEFPIDQKFDFLAYKANEFTKPIYNHHDAQREFVKEWNMINKQNFP